MSSSSSRREGSDRRGAVLREARERLGLSQRQLAERMSISWAAISQAENGADISHRTLREFLKALPGLTPRELLRGPRPLGEQTRKEAWTYYRDLFGVEAAQIERSLVARFDGSREDRFRCSGLRSIRERPSEVRMLDGLESVAYQGSRPLLAEIRAGLTAGGSGDESVRSRVLERREGRLLHQLSVPADLVREGLSYSWTRLRQVTGLWREESPSFQPPDGMRVHSGFGQRVTFPARRLLLRLHLPENYWPETIYLRTWPSAMVPDPRVRDFTEQVHPEGLKLRRDRRRRLVSLTVDYPLIDWSYNIGWILPPRPGG